MRILLMSVLILYMVQAQNITQLIHSALQKHPSLQTIQQRISAMDEKILLSQKLENPDVSLSINDIQFNKPLHRDLEPMQYQAVQFKQKFPWFGKLDAHKTYVQTQKKIILHSLDVAKVTLAENIRITAYSIKELESRIKIVKNYIDVAQQNIKLYTSYASTDTKSHTNSMNASLLLTKVNIKLAHYKALLKSQKAKLKYLTQEDINHLQVSLSMQKPKSLHYYLSRIEHNPNYHIYLSKKERALANQTVQELNSMPDPYVKAGYFNREGYRDYTTITIGASIPLYGSEKLKSEVARKEVLASSSASLDYKSTLYEKIETLYAKLTEAHTIYTIIHTQTLPQLEHMFELTQASIQQGGDLFAYTNLLEQKLDLEEQSISIQAQYRKTQAKLKALIGEIE